MRPRGIDPVAEEYVDELLLGIYPEAGAGKAQVADGGRRCLECGGAFVGLFRVGFVKSQSAAAGGALFGHEAVHGLGRQYLLAAVAAVVEPHLAQFGQVVGRGEESGIALHTAEEGGRLVVHIAVELLVAVEEVVFGGGNPLDGESGGRAVSCGAHAQRSVDMLLQVAVHGYPGGTLDRLFQQDEIEATVQIAFRGT